MSMHTSFMNKQCNVCVIHKGTFYDANLEILDMCGNPSSRTSAFELIYCMSPVAVSRFMVVRFKAHL